MTNPTDDDPPVRVLSEDLVLVDWGPMTLTISVWDEGKARPVMAAQAARTALSCLAILSDFQEFLRKPAHLLPVHPNFPATAAVVRRAFRAAQTVSGNLTPLAAVAGAVADEVAAAAAEMGADRVIVNNGGNVALRLGPAETAVVGLRLTGGRGYAGQLTVRGDANVGGVASSGWRGRSHSPGTADLATVWADSAARADAAATLLAGATRLDGSDVGKVRAGDIDPLSDVRDQSVTISAGRLTKARKQRALDRASETARRLHENGHILGCCVWLQGEGFSLDPGGVLAV